MNKHDKEEIAKLIEFKKWVLQFRKMNKEEKEEHFKNRWKDGENGKSIHRM